MWTWDIKRVIFIASAKRFFPVISVMGVWNVAKLGITVIVCFAFQWLPFCVIEGFNKELVPRCLAAWQHILHRVFPFHRGVFEDKVANVWCSVDSLGIIKFKKLFSQQQMALICLVATVVSIIPCCIDLFRSRPSQKKLLWALFNCSLSFFLFSFQVHEKSILWPLMPIARKSVPITAFCCNTLHSTFWRCTGPVLLVQFSCSLQVSILHGNISASTLMSDTKHVTIARTRQVASSLHAAFFGILPEQSALFWEGTADSSSPMA